MRRFGLIGKPLTHSFSKEFFSKKFLTQQISDAEYGLFPLKSIDELPELIETNQALIGLNVTIPFKELVIPFLDELDPVAAEVGAVNTIKITRTKEGVHLKGFNTDVIGFKEAIKPFLGIEHNRALIFGTGGAAKAVAYVLKQFNLSYFFVSRTIQNSNTISYKEIDAEAIKSFRLLINTTPLGTFPNVAEMIPISLEGISEKHLVIDLIYNPSETKLLSLAKQEKANTLNGLSMLQFQAEASWRIWNEN